MTDLIARSLADAFMQVGVFVAVLVVAFGFLQLRHGERLLAAIESHRRAGPLLGAALGVTPGCGGAILVMPLYLRGTVSFGTVVAAVTATMGDASFILLAVDWQLALWVHALLLVVGTVTGYGVDALGLAPRARRRPAPAGRVAPVVAAPVPRAVGAAPTPPALAATRVETAPVPTLGVVPAAFWWLAAVGFAVAVPVSFQLVDPAALAAAFGGVDPYLLVGVAGTLVAVGVFVQSGGRFADDCEASIRHRATSVRAMLAHGARETAFVTVWVAVAYLGYELLVAATGLDVTALVGVGIVGVLAGAGIGLIPGCAAQIVLVGLYAGGGLPLPALLANAVSQDGDALFPLLLLDRRAAVTTTVVTTVPALLVGAGALLVGW